VLDLGCAGGYKPPAHPATRAGMSQKEDKLFNFLTIL